MMLRSFARMPFGIQKEIGLYYLKRIVGLTPTDQQTIWASFLYFSVPKVFRVAQEGGWYLVDFEFGRKQLKTSIRVGNNSDILVFFQVFIAEGYKPLFDFLRKKALAPRVIVDAGANVGYFSLLALCHYDPDILIALEPEKSNYFQLERNMEVHNHYNNFRCMRCAIWTEKKLLSVKTSAGREWATRVSKNAAAEVCQALSLKDVMEENKAAGIDVLKLDVEGTEDVLFRNTIFLETLEKVKVMGIEIHDDLTDKKMIQEELTKRNFNFFERGELTVAWNTKFVHE